jgi:hypothetical protein
VEDLELNICAVKKKKTEIAAWSQAKEASLGITLVAESPSVIGRSEIHIGPSVNRFSPEAGGG